jgi:hypothetical protein
MTLNSYLKGSIKVKRMRVGCNPEKHLPRVLNAAASRS